MRSNIDLYVHVSSRLTLHIDGGNAVVMQGFWQVVIC